MKLSQIRFLKLAITNKCNSHCITCSHSNLTKHNFIQDLKPQVYRQIRDKLFPHLKILNFLSGGEFFMCSYVDEVIEDVIKGTFKTTIESNFSVMSNAQRERLAKANVRFIVSLDGSTKQLQEFLRPQCTYERVLENIRFFVEHKKRVAIRMTVSNHNFYDMRNMIQLAEELGVESVICHGAEELSQLERPLKFTVPPNDVAYIKSLRSLKWKVDWDLFLPCYWSSSMLFSPRRACYIVADPMTAQGAGIAIKLQSLWSAILGRDFCAIPRNFINIDNDGKVYFCSCPECDSIGDPGLSKWTLEQILDHPEFDKRREACSCTLSRRFARASK